MHLKWYTRKGKIFVCPNAALCIWTVNLCFGMKEDITAQKFLNHPELSAIWRLLCMGRRNIFRFVAQLNKIASFNLAKRYMGYHNANEHLSIPGAGKTINQTHKADKTPISAWISLVQYIGKLKRRLGNTI